MKSTGVLVLAYGSAPSMEDEAIFAYLRHILQHYRSTDPTPEELADLRRRYQAIGGSPLYATTEEIIQGIQEGLDLRFPQQTRVYMAMKHSPPYIEDVVSQMACDGVEQAVAVALAPFRSRLSTESYYGMVRETNQTQDQPIDWSFAGDWNLNPLFLQLWQDRVQEAVSNGNQGAAVIFTNHSLPARILKWNDPYPDQFQITAKALAENCRLSEWAIAYQSAGGGGQPWLGPDLETVLEERKSEGHSRFLLVPIGFLMDHLEILYDLDTEAQSRAQEMGIDIARTRMPNADPLLVAMLTEIIADKLPRRTHAKEP